MSALAVVAVANGRIAKFAKFETLAEAEAHVANHGGFAVDNPPDTPNNLSVSGQAVNVDKYVEPTRKRPSELEDIPANVNSVPALRDEINALKAYLRGT